MLEEYRLAKAEHQAAEKKLKEILEKKARELYPLYDQYDENDDWYETSGAMTKVSCRKHAQHALEELISQSTST